MLESFWHHFKSGTDIRGVGTEGVPGQPVDLTDEIVTRMARGFALWLSERLERDCAELTVSVGRDCRLSGPRIASAVEKALAEAGASVLSCGLSSTPAMFMTTVDLACDGAVQITASHHPFQRNGLKFFTRFGGLEGADIEKILLFAQESAAPEGKKGHIQAVNYMPAYAARLRELICKGVNAADYGHPLKGFRIVVDAGNGAGGFYATEVLSPLGADVSGSQFLEPDGSFPNHIPNPENEEAMRSVSEAVVRAGADLGVIFDTDVDRGGAVDSGGREINRNRLLALTAAMLLEDAPGGTIVTDSITSYGLTDFIEQKLGGHHYPYRRGYKNVIDKALELNAQGIDCPAAGETSGHVALRENYFLDDGAYLLTRVIVLMARLRAEGRTLESLISELKEPLEEAELRMAILEPEFKVCGERVLSGLEVFAKEQPGWEIDRNNREGVRIKTATGAGEGWFLLRLSVHDPILPLNLESDAKGGVQQMVKTLYTYLSGCEGIECGRLKAYLGL